MYKFIFEVQVEILYYFLDLYKFIFVVRVEILYYFLEFVKIYFRGTCAGGTSTGNKYRCYYCETWHNWEVRAVPKFRGGRDGTNLNIRHFTLPITIVIWEGCSVPKVMRLLEDDGINNLVYKIIRDQIWEP